jgi:hypothetical protein
LAFTAGKDPQRVYPHFEAVAELLGSGSKIVRWNAMQILASLAPVVDANRVEPLIEVFATFVRGDNLISAANAIQGLGKIARAKPVWVDRILPVLLKAETATYETPECRNVAIGGVLDVLGELWPRVRDRKEVMAFVQRQQASTRAAVGRRAVQLASSLA